MKQPGEQLRIKAIRTVPDVTESTAGMFSARPTVGAIDADGAVYVYDMYRKGWVGLNMTLLAPMTEQEAKAADEARRR